MMEALSLRAPPIQSLVPPSPNNNATTIIDANNKRLYFSRARELVAAQAKTLSFLTYLLRGFSNELKPYEDRLASNVVALMSTCPRESISTRKELLVATRHLLNSEFRTGFFRHVDALLDERVLMGCNHRYSEQTVLRPLGYTALSDLVHHVKALLTMSQMSKGTYHPLFCSSNHIHQRFTRGAETEFTYVEDCMLNPSTESCY